MSKGLFCPYDVNLEGVEWLVFSALSLLASKQPWNGTKEQLANLSRCGSRFTAARSLDHLIELGLVIKTENGYYVQNARSDEQNARSDVQNARSDEQNAQNSKESNKENINNIFKGEGDISRTPTREFGENNFSKNVIWDRPATWQECRDYCYQFHGTKETYEKFYRHYEATGWFGIRNWRAKLRNWIVEDNKRDMLEQQRQQRYDPNYR